MKHEHPPPKGCPFDFSMPIDCNACRVLIWTWRQELCDKYGWDKWPDDLNRGRDYFALPDGVYDE